MILDLIRIFRWSPVPVHPEEYWNPQALTEEESRKLCSISLDEKGNAFGYNPAHQANPAWKGNNKSRIGMLFDPYFHPMGMFLQGTIKGALQKCTDFVHSSILRYDAEAYTYEDARLQELDSTIKGTVSELFYDELEARSRGDGSRKIRILLKAVDIALFLMKEDIAYRWRFILLMQRVGRVVEQMQPTPEELVNLKRLQRR